MSIKQMTIGEQRSGVKPQESSKNQAAKITIILNKPAY